MAIGPRGHTFFAKVNEVSCSPSTKKHAKIASFQRRNCFEDVKCTKCDWFLRAQVDTLEQVTNISPNVLVFVCDGSVLTRVCSL